MLGVVYIVTYHVGELLACYRQLADYCWAVGRLLGAWRRAACWALGAASGVPGSGRAAGVLGGKRRAGQWAGGWRAWQAACWAVGGLLACLAASGGLGIALGGRLA